MPDQELERLRVSQLRAGRFHGVHPELAERQQQAPLLLGRKVAVLHRDKETGAGGIRRQRAVDAVGRPAPFDEDIEQLLGESHRLGVRHGDHAKFDR